MKGWTIFILAFAIYFVSIFGGFVQDDGKVIESDREMGTAGALVSVWTRPYYYMENEKSVYRPVTSFSFYLNALITGKEAWGFRLGNVLLYGWVCVLVYEMLRCLLLGIACNAPTSWWKDLALWGAVVFAILPIHTEVVNNIVGRAELLSLGFVLLAVLKVLERKWELGALFLFLAMLSKETAVVGVPIVLYLIWSDREIKNEEKWGAGFLTSMALVGFLLLRMVILGGVGTGNNATMVENPLKFVIAEKRVMNAISLIPFGVGKIVFPVNLSYDYSYNQIKLVDSWFYWRVLVGLAMMLLSVAYLIFPGWRRTKEGLQGKALKVVGMMMFWGPILITGNILFPIGTIFGERLWFWSSLGVIMILISLFASSSRMRGSINWYYLDGSLVKPGMTIMFVILAVYAGRTWVRNLDWLSQEKLFLHDANYATKSVMAQSNAAAIYLMKQDLVKGKRIMDKANAIYPKYPELLNNQGMYFLWIGNKGEAENKFEECLVERQGNGLCQTNLELIR